MLKIKITALTPIHIGSGGVYEPTNFIIDNKILYYFKSEDFFMNLPQIEQKAFLDILNKANVNSFVRIHSFVKQHKDIAKKIAFLKVATSQGIQNKYNQAVGKIVHRERISNVFNKFEIQKIQRKQIILSSEKIGFVGYIPGSSLKGAITTAYEEFLFKNNRNKYNNFVNSKPENHPFKNLKIADSKVTGPKHKIGFAVNRERFEDDETGPSTFIEVINQGATFEVDINYESLNIREILESCNLHYKPIFDSMFDMELDNTGTYFSDEFFNKYSNLQLNKNQFLIRVGKHSGARAVTIDGLREINVKESKYKWEKDEEETTTWLFGDDEKQEENLIPFGWILCEIVD